MWASGILSQHYSLSGTWPRDLLDTQENTFLILRLFLYVSLVLRFCVDCFLLSQYLSLPSCDVSIDAFLSLSLSFSAWLSAFGQITALLSPSGLPFFEMRQSPGVYSLVPCAGCPMGMLVSFILILLYVCTVSP